MPLRLGPPRCRFPLAGADPAGPDRDPGRRSSSPALPINNAWIIFALLFGLMLTGMPISISLGLTVLTYLFTMTNGADRVGGAQAVHRHRAVRDHGDPVLHPRRQLPHARRRRAADDQRSPSSMVSHWHGRPRVWRA